MSVVADRELSNIPYTYGDLIDSAHHPSMMRGLLQLVRDSADPQVRSEIMFALKMAVDDAESRVWDSELSGINLEDALNQTTDLYKKFVDAGAIPILTEALSDPDNNVREYAVGVLGNLGDTRAVPALTELLCDPEVNIRREVARVLGQLGDIRAVPALIEALGDLDEDVRRWAASSLTEPKMIWRSREDYRVVTYWIEVLRNSDSSAALALGKLADTRGVPTLIETLRCSEKWGIQHAGDTLDETVTELIKDLDSPSVDYRRMAAYALGRANDSRAVPALMRAMWERDGYVRPVVADSLIRQLKSRKGITASAVGPLVRTLWSGDEYTHTQAATALNKLGSAGWVECWSVIIATLVKILFHPILGRWVNRGRISDMRIVPALIEAMNDPESSVRSQAEDALVRILTPLGGLWNILDIIKRTSDSDKCIRELARSNLIRLGNPE